MANERTKCPLTDDQIKHMVNRFLAWKLPEDFTPDAGISFKPILRDGEPWPEAWPVGTNLLMATQAEAMIRYMVDGIQHGGVCLWCGFSTTRGSLDELADAIYAHLGECHASPVPALQSAIHASQARERDLQGKLEEAVAEANAMAQGFAILEAASPENPDLDHAASIFRRVKKAESERDAALAQVVAMKEWIETTAQHPAFCGANWFIVGSYARDTCTCGKASILNDTSAAAQQFVARIEREALEKAWERIKTLETRGLSGTFLNLMAYLGSFHAGRIRAAILGEKGQG